MALDAGDAGCTSGLSKRIYDGFATLTTSTPALLLAVVTPQLKGMAHAIATGVVDEIQANAAVSVIVSTGGLQKSTSAGTPTDAPTTPQTLTGTVL